jgi:hypothetical protein
MLSHLDCIIFPDRCEVIEVVPSQRYVYPIFKNGQSSLLAETTKSTWRIYLNEQIKRINRIDIFLRDPTERLASGLSSFIQTTVRDHPDLDSNTVSWFAENYLHLNRHYSSQFSWLVNLARYTNPDCVLNFLGMDDIKTITHFHKRPFDQLPVNTKLKNNEMYQRIDQILFDNIGSAMTFGQLITHIKKTDTHAYDWVIGRSQRILSPTYVLS